jgi:hypothetical protein
MPVRKPRPCALHGAAAEEPVCSWQNRARPRRQVFEGLQNPNCCSRRTPMKMRLIMLARRWMRPACSQVHDSSRQAWFPCTTLYQSRAPYLCSLRAAGRRRGRLEIRRDEMRPREASRDQWIVLLDGREGDEFARREVALLTWRPWGRGGGSP